MSGYASYDDALNPKHGEPFEVPLFRATAESLKDFGRIVHDFDAEEVWIETWPQTGRRSICPGTGRGGGVAEGAFRYWWERDLLRGTNEAVQTAEQCYTIGRLPRGVSPARRTHVLCREANYHPDGGQVFFVEDHKPFVGLFAIPGDEIQLKDFHAFYFDGSFGIQIFPNIWHQPMYPVEDVTTFKGKQGGVHACVALDIVEEFNKYLRIPLLAEFITEL